MFEVVVVSIFIIKDILLYLGYLRSVRFNVFVDEILAGSRRRANVLALSVVVKTSSFSFRGPINRRYTFDAVCPLHIICFNDEHCFFASTVFSRRVGDKERSAFFTERF